MLYVGIDPGLAGGIATIDEQRRVVRVVHMPKTEYSLLEELKVIAWLASEKNVAGRGPVIVMLEDVWSTPQMGVASAFTFGKGVGKILMGLEAASLPFHKVAPLKWQNALGVITPKAVRQKLGHKDKNINKAKAQELFPRVEVTHAIADALLLAEYCWRDQGGRLFNDSAVEVPRGKERKAGNARRHRRRS